MFDNKVILVTGGTGSFGKAFVHKLLNDHKPHAVRIYSRDELKQHDMRIEFNDDDRLRFLIGDVRDRSRLTRAMEGCDFVVHAAAVKQVPTCEYNPIEAIRTNVDGAINVIEAALDTNVDKVVALSTDKAVNPINLYGATKLCSDKLFVQANQYRGPDRRVTFSVVRYGNVLGSRGSVIPVFRKQLQKGNTVTLTDKRMTRFWITLDQATDFVVDSFNMMNGGEIFVPKIPSMKIVDLAKVMAPDCEFKEIGIRAGEKLEEYLISAEEGRSTKVHSDRYIIEPTFENYESIPGTEPVADGFEYNSRDNEEWLEDGALAEILKNL